MSPAGRFNATQLKFISARPSVLTQLDRATLTGLKAIAIEVAGEARRRTPVDTGRLRASIAWAAGGPREHKGRAKGSDGEEVVVQYAAEAPQGEARVGSNVEYAPYVHEFLHAKHKTGEAKFIENAFHAKESRAKELAKLALQGLL